MSQNWYAKECGPGDKIGLDLNCVTGWERSDGRFGQPQSLSYPVMTAQRTDRPYQILMNSGHSFDVDEGTFNEIIMALGAFPSRVGAVLAKP
mgnify:CR=1 FL=1